MMNEQEFANSSGEMPMAAFIREGSPDGDVLHVIGEIDLANADEFAAAVMELAKSEGTIVVDLTACSYMDSSGLRVLATAHKTVEDRLRVVIPKNGTVHRIFDITGLAARFSAHENVDAALRTQEPQTPPRR